MKLDKMNRRKINAAETKKLIYQTANQLFREHGFENVSVDAIVEAAGVSKGAFYVHFESKDSLIASLIIDYVNEVDMDYKSYIESFGVETPASEILIMLIGKIADILIQKIGREHMKAIYKAQITKTINTDSVMGYGRELYVMFSQIISRGIQREEFIKEIPVDTIAKHYVMAIRGLSYEWCIRNNDFDLKEQALQHFKILLNGIKNFI